MDRSIASLSGHVILCGWGRVGRSIAPEMASAGRSIVTIEIDPDATIDASMLAVTGDATSDDVLRAAGVERASALIAAADSDAVNSFITLSARAINPELFIVARVRSDDSGRKLRRAGADRVVNPQSIGGMRMAAFVLRPNVAEFVDVAMHEDRFEFRLEEVTISEASPLAGTTLRDAQVRERTGALVLALRGPDESFQTNPKPETTLRPGHVIIAVGTQDELASLTGFARG